MAGAWLTFDERKSVLKWYIKFENVEVCQWKREIQTQPPTRLTITGFCDKFDTHGTICDVHRGRSGRPLTATSLCIFSNGFGKVYNVATEVCLYYVYVTRVSRTSVRGILKAFEWKVNIPRLLQAINDDPDCRMHFCEWF